MHYIIQQEAASNSKKKSSTITDTDGNMEKVPEAGQAEGRETSGEAERPRTAGLKEAGVIPLDAQGTREFLYTRSSKVKDSQQWCWGAVQCRFEWAMAEKESGFRSYLPGPLCSY